MSNGYIAALVVLAAPALVQCDHCTTPHGFVHASQWSSGGVASVVFDAPATSANAQLASVDQGMLTVNNFGVDSAAYFEEGFLGSSGQENATLRAYNNGDVFFWFGLGDDAIISCKTTLTKLAAGTSTLSDLCESAALSLGPVGKPPVEVTYLTVYEGPQGAVQGEGANDSVMMNSEFSIYIDLRQVAGTVTSSVALDENGDGTVSIAVDIPPTTVTTWYTESFADPTGQGPDAVQISVTGLTGTVTVSDAPTACEPPSLI